MTGKCVKKIVKARPTAFYMPQEITKKKEKNPYLPTHFENFIKQETHNQFSLAQGQTKITPLFPVTLF